MKIYKYMEEQEYKIFSPMAYFMSWEDYKKQMVHSAVSRGKEK